MSLIPFVILDVDARDKRGHDESNIARIGITGAAQPVLDPYDHSRLLAMRAPSDSDLSFAQATSG